MDSCRVVGLISGTSVDAIDVAVADMRIDEGVIELAPAGHTELSYPPHLRDELLAMASRGTSAEQLCKLDTRIGQSFAHAAATAISEFGPADVVASLGQTVYHWVEDGTCLGTLQLGQPAWIAELTGLPVVADLRVRDVAAGGHGAPLAGLFDRMWLREEIALNLGGIANITLPGDIAFDTGPGNALLDAAAEMLTGKPFDEDGALALAGSVREDLLEQLLADPYYRLDPPKSTGKEHFNTGYLTAELAKVPEVGAADLMATLAELTAVTVAHACAGPGGPRRVVASGGGVRNPALMAALARRLDVVTSDELGIPSGAKEAYLTALLGFLTWHGIPADPRTGAGPRLLGGITPGRDPLRMPAPAADNVSQLRVVEKLGGHLARS
ncbi:anhydro-N-acetylmuramic acid kinase [Kibdelosporangium phytohabitans]|uniref:Anhydro-N-acetylmuramic acid kinase n=1 Tax=Kibdelosporangium phytohabitans TaxID=860235 RepID=A0A0N7F526_9PSEU|nr:anhydro-N-acetylmuramic acid kinase [Kibdelosporangium phytohabitans]ALG13055.1 anhydro-N-acetylmuramic acid kinase [Kibdelosporangium phytohabitans]MBE1464792.1 anhydro-N-acetylmuramic acid kinase [Kibdelosporangium phytohabitans]